jgi:hypothetical protein
VAGLVGTVLAFHVPVYWNYWLMTAKSTHDTEYKAFIERLPEHRLLVLANVYNMHRLQAFWPTNCTPAAAPVWNNPEERRQLRVADWALQVSRTYPNIVFSVDDTVFDDEVMASLHRAFTGYREFNTTPAEHALQAWGQNPMMTPTAGHGVHVFYSTGADLRRRAEDTGRPLAILPGSMPLLTTRDISGAYRLWRALVQPVEIAIRNPAPTNVMHTLRLPVARLSGEAEILLIPPRGAPRVVTVPPANSWVVLPDTGRTEQRAVSLQEVDRLKYHVPMDIATHEIAVEVGLPPGETNVRLIPRKMASLLAPAPDSSLSLAQ